MNHFKDAFWQAYLVNFLFWSGLAQGSVILAATLDITGARWGRPYVRIARSFAGFLPVSIPVLGIMFIGRNYLFPWIAQPLPENAAYLNIGFLAARDLIGLALLTILSWVVLTKEKNRRTDSPSLANPEERGASPWSVALVAMFMVVYSYLAFDLIMSLRPNWYSTLLGAHYAVSSFYLGIAGLVLVSCLRAGVAEEDRARLSLLLFGMSSFWLSLLWSQYIVIWYGDMPEETSFVYLRFYQMPWAALTITVIVLGWVLPFFVLLPRRAKRKGATQLLASVSIIVALILERHLLVVPSLSPKDISLGWTQLFVTAAFACLFIICYRLSAAGTRTPERLPKTI